MLIKMRESKGFTLVELMIVVAIIGILAAVAVPYYQRYVAKSRLTSLVFPGVHAIENALSTKFAVSGTLPATAATAAIASLAANMRAYSSDAPLDYISQLGWTNNGTGSGGSLEVIINRSTTDAKFAALSTGTLTATATEGPGTLYWSYSGNLASQLGF